MRRRRWRGGANRGASSSALLEARRTGGDTPAALAAFDVAADNVRASMRPHRLYRSVLRLTRASLAPHAADAGEAFLSCRTPAHALAVTEPGPRERATATATAIGILRRALADPAAL